LEKNVQLSKMNHTLENGPHLKNWVTLGKNGSHLKKWVTLGKMAHTWYQLRCQGLSSSRPARAREVEMASVLQNFSGTKFGFLDREVRCDWAK